MGVYIKGMEMPTSCSDCWALDDDGDYPRCRITEEQRGYNFRIREKRMDHCPLVPVTPHGRLIDADKLGIRDAEKQAYEAYLREKGEDFIEEPLLEYLRGRSEGLTQASSHVRFAPTIIPASEEDEHIVPSQTRGDSIRAKSNEELANFLVECKGCPPDLVGEYCGAVGCLKCWLNWLQKEEKINDG